MSNPWFRMYSEFSHDPKVQMMSEAMQRRYIMLLCLQCSNVLVTLHVTEIAFHLRISDEELSETKALFISKKFIDEDWKLLNWKKRQFSSDDSKPRVAKHRALQKRKQESLCNVTQPLQSRPCNGLDTDTDTDTDTDKRGGARARDPKIPPPQISEEFRQTIKTERPELDADMVFANFCGNYSPEKRTAAKWKKWVLSEYAPPDAATPPSTADPDSKASVEALGMSLGMGKWDELSEPWSAYKSKVRGVAA